MDAILKTKSAASRHNAGRRAAACFILLTWGLASLSCSRNLVSPAQITATVQAVPTLTMFTAAEVSPTVTADAGQNDLQVAPTREPTGTADPFEPTPTERPTQDPPILYYTQAGDTLKALAVRFNVQPSEITSPEKIKTEGLFDPGILLLIPRRLDEMSSSTPLIPDSEVVYSPSALDFDFKKFAQEAGGKLAKDYREWRTDGWYDGPGVIQRVAIENSINPRLLLVILERQSHWVYGQPQNIAQTDYPIGWLRAENDKKGLYFQLSWAVQQLNIGYYGWRGGTLTDLTFPDGKKLRLAPDLNAGTVALLYLFSRLYTQPQWAGVLYGPDGLMTQYENMFGNPWLRAQTVEPLFPATLTQPSLELPFLPDRTWSLTGGPHSAWGPDGATAALDFAPSSDKHGCYESTEWVTAVAAGLVVRSKNAQVVLDLDGDGYEQTGWAILYMHVATKDRVPEGTWVSLNDPIGHPSCEGGVTTGTHTHIARKYNGEWILCDGPMPFVLSGWQAHAGAGLYKGSLTKDGQTVYASDVGSYESRVTRP
jgi:LasA protease